MVEGISWSISMRVPYPKYESSLASALPTYGDEVLQLRYYVNVRWFYFEEILLLGYSVMSVGFTLKGLGPVLTMFGKSTSENQKSKINV